MRPTVCLCANALRFPHAGGHLWVYLNWALGLQALGCAVVWLEGVDPHSSLATTQAQVAALRARLARYDLGDSLALYSWTDDPVGAEVDGPQPSLDRAQDADLLLNMAYNIPAAVLRRFRRTALIDIDPGLAQIWISEGQMEIEPHDAYFTIGETVGQPGALFPDCGLPWQYTPPPVHLAAWPPSGAAPTAPFTTVTHWASDMVAFRGDCFHNGKREGFLPYLDLPLRTAAPLELAINLDGHPADLVATEWAALTDRGWRLRHAEEVSATPWGYQQYVQGSRGEFSCAKPSCIRLQNAWVSDRTLCYLASGKPAVVQHTGPSRVLPDRAGLLRFSTIDEAVECLDAVATDYDHHCRLARALAAEHFDATAVVRRVLERALP